MGIKNATKKEKPIIGIIGGAGHDATIDIQIKISKSMKEKIIISRDQDYYGVITLNDSQLPDRTDFLIQGGEPPNSIYIKKAKILEASGADVIILACNTAHAIIENIQASLNTNIINMIEEVAKFFLYHYPRIKKVGLLASLGTIHAKLYHNTFSKYGIEIVTCDGDMCKKVHQAIYAIKTGFINESYNIQPKHSQKAMVTKDLLYPQKLIISALECLRSQNIKHTILGCTELPLVVSSSIYRWQIIIDPNQIIADAAVNYCLKLEQASV